jgi:hypothetical protein
MYAPDRADAVNGRHRRQVGGFSNLCMFPLRATDRWTARLESWAQRRQRLRAVPRWLRPHLHALLTPGTAATRKERRVEAP